MALASNSCLSNFRQGILLSLRSRQWLEIDQTFCLTELCLWVLPSAFDLSCQSQRGAEDSVVTCQRQADTSSVTVPVFLWHFESQGCCIFVPHVVLCWQDTIYIWPSCPLPASQGLGCVGCNPLLSVSGFVLLSSGSISRMLFFISVTGMTSKQWCHFWVPAKLYALCYHP